MKYLLNIIFSVLAIIFTCFIFWASGYDFNHRGFEAVYCIVCNFLMVAIANGLAQIFKVKP